MDNERTKDEDWQEDWQARAERAEAKLRRIYTAWGEVRKSMDRGPARRGRGAAGASPGLDGEGE